MTSGILRKLEESYRSPVFSVKVNENSGLTPQNWHDRRGKKLGSLAALCDTRSRIVLSRHCLWMQRRRSGCLRVSG